MQQTTETEYHLVECDDCDASGVEDDGKYCGLNKYYKYDSKNKIYLGSGCSECGYTGKRVQYFPVPAEYSMNVVSEIVAR